MPASSSRKKRKRSGEDEAHVLSVVGKNGRALKRFPLWNTVLRVVLAAVKQYGLALQYASPDLQNNEEVVNAAIEENGHAFQFASPRLQNDEDFVEEAIEIDVRAFQHASFHLRDTLSIVADAILHEPESVFHASKRLKKDKLIVMAAIYMDIHEELDVADIVEENSKLLTDEEVILANIFANPKVGKNYQHCPWAKKAHMHSLLCQLGLPQWQNKQWNPAPYFEKYFEIMEQFGIQQHFSDDDVPDEHKCPITLQPMVDPVITADGHSYERAAIQQWFEYHQTSPKTGARLQSKTLIPNQALKGLIAEWSEKHQKLLQQPPADTPMTDHAPAPNKTTPKQGDVNARMAEQRIKEAHEHKEVLDVILQDRGEELQCIVMQMRWVKRLGELNGRDDVMRHIAKGKQLLVDLEIKTKLLRDEENELWGRLHEIALELSACIEL